MSLVDAVWGTSARAEFSTVDVKFGGLESDALDCRFGSGLDASTAFAKESAWLLY